MNKFLSALIAPILAAFPLLASAQPVQPDLDAQVHCSVVFGLIAREQNNGRSGARRFPAMDEPGKAFFVKTGMRLLDERKMPIEDLEAFYVARVGEVDAALGSGSTRAKALDAEYAGCVPLFAQVVPDAPPLVK